MGRKSRRHQSKASVGVAGIGALLENVELIREKIFAPIIWKEITDYNVKIQDLHEPRYEETVKLVEEHFLDEDLLCRNVNISQDAESVESYLDRVMFNLRFKQSIVAIDVEKDQIVGVLVMKMQSRNDYGTVFDRIQILKGESHKTIVKFLGLLTRKFNIFDHFEIDRYLEYMFLCIDKDYRHKGLGYKMMQSGLKVAMAMQCTIIAGTFKTFRLQTLADKMGLEVLFKMNYTDYKDEEGEMIFPEPGAGNYFCAIMGGEVKPPPPSPPPSTDESYEPPKESDEDKMKRRMKQLAAQIVRPLSMESVNETSTP